MKTKDLIKKIDFTLLRTQKKTLIKIIDELEKSGEESDKLNDLCGILNFIDGIQDFAVDIVGLNPMNVYDFELEESREDVTKNVTLCAVCNSDDVTIKENNKGYCMICGKEVNTYKAKHIPIVKIIGYQIVGALNEKHDGENHPDMVSDYALYSLKQAREMITNDRDNWIILSIWSDEIETPLFMFNGNPDNNHEK